MCYRKGIGSCRFSIYEYFREGQITQGVSLAFELRPVRLVLVFVVSWFRGLISRATVYIFVLLMCGNKPSGALYAMP